MIKYNKPLNLNGRELVAELNAAGIVVNLDKSPMVDGNDDLWLDIDTQDEAKAKNIVDAHNGNIIPFAYSERRGALLERLGITEEEARLLIS